MAAGTVSDWASLPRDLLDLIQGRMFEFSDFIRFGYVCKSWLSTALEPHRHNRRFTPMLMTPTKDNSIRNRNLYSITEGAVYGIQLPMPCSRRFCGSSQGWLFMIDKSMNITLINPFLIKTLVLPKFQVPTKDYWDYQDETNIIRENHYDFFVVKAIILPSGTRQDHDNFEVLLLYSAMGRLAYLNKSHDGGAWKSIELKEGKRGPSVFSDIICYQGQVYAVSFWSSLVRVDVITCTFTTVVRRAKVFANTTYLVESQNGDLLLVRRFLKWLKDDDHDFDDDIHMHMTKAFEVYKLSWEEDGKLTWVQVESLGEQALFLGDNYSMSISTQDFPGCKPNCVYYADHFFDQNGCYMPRGADDDSGIYNMEDKSFTRHYTPDVSHCPPSTPSIWIVPN